MKRQHIASIVIVSASIFVVGSTLGQQDRFTLKSPSGIAFSEFRGYDAWPVTATGQPDDAGGCGTSPAPGCIKAIVGNPVLIKAYSDGVPANGQCVPDGDIEPPINTFPTAL